MMSGIAELRRERPGVDLAADQAEPGKRPIGGLLRQRNFALLWSGETVSTVGSAMAAVAVPLLAVVVLRASTFGVSALAAAAYLPWLVIGLPVGAWVDRLPPRPVLIISDLVSAVLYASLPAAAWAHVLTIGQVLFVELAAGAAGIFFTTAYIVYLPVLVHADDLLEGNAKLSGSQSVASISGRGLAGLAARAVGTANALLFNAGSFFVSLACLLAIRTAEPRSTRDRAKRTTTLRADIAEGLLLIWRDRLLRTLAIFPAVSNMALGGVLALSVLFLVRVAHIGAAEVGLLLAVGDVGGLAGALVARRVAQRVGTARILLLGVLVAGLAGLLIPMTAAGPRAAYFAAGSGLVFAAIASNNIVLISFRQTYTPAEILGRVIASQRFIVFGTAPLGALLAGALGTTLGVRSALWVLVAVFALSGTLLLNRSFLSRRDLPTSPDQIRPAAHASTTPAPYLGRTDNDGTGSGDA